MGWYGSGRCFLHSHYTTGISLFAVCQFFAVSWRTAKRHFAVCLQKTDGKELTDGKDASCHQPIICCLPADGKESLPCAGGWQRGGAISFFAGTKKIVDPHLLSLSPLSPHGPHLLSLSPLSLPLVSPSPSREHLRRPISASSDGIRRRPAHPRDPLAPLLHPLRPDLTRASSSDHV